MINAEDFMRAGLSRADAAHFAERVEAAAQKAAQADMRSASTRAADIADAAKAAHDRLADLARPPKWLIEALTAILCDATKAAAQAHRAAPSAPEAMTIKALAWAPNAMGRMTAIGVGGIYGVEPQKIGRARLLFCPDSCGKNHLISEIEGDADMRRIGQEHHAARVRRFLEGGAA